MIKCRKLQILRSMIPCGDNYNGVFVCQRSIDHEGPHAGCIVRGSLVHYWPDVGSLLYLDTLWYGSCKTEDCLRTLDLWKDEYKWMP